MISNTEIVERIGGVGLSKALHFLFGLLTLFVLARNLSFSEFGSYIYFSASVYFLGVGFLFGYQREIVRIAANGKAGADWGAVGKAFLTVPVIQFMAAVALVVILAYIGAPFLPSPNENVSEMQAAYGSLLILGASVFLYGVNMFLSGLLRGVDSYTIASYFQYTLPSLLMLLGSVLLSSFRMLELPYVFALVGLSQGAIALFSVSVIEKRVGIMSHASLGNTFGIGTGYLALYETLIMSQTYLHLYLVTSVDIQQAALFGAVYRLSSYVLAPLTIGNDAFSPKIAEYYYSDKPIALQKLLSVAAVLAGAPALLIMCVIAIFSENFLGWLYGLDYVTGSQGLVIVLSGHLVAVLTGSHGSLMVMAGRSRILFFSLSLSVITGTAVTAMLVAEWGYLAACLGMSLGIVLNNLICWAACRVSLGFDTRFRFLELLALKDIRGWKASFL